MSAELLVSERKFLFASSVVGYSTCHWCHVMERESFESEEIAKILNEKFVSVKVDREERPDVDKVYMTYIQVSVMKYTLIYFREVVLENICISTIDDVLVLAAVSDF